MQYEFSEHHLCTTGLESSISCPLESLGADAHARPVALLAEPLFTPLTDAPEVDQGACLS